MLTLGNLLIINPSILKERKTQLR